MPTLGPSPIPATATPQLVTIFSDPLTGNTNGWPVQNGCSFGSTGYDVDGGSQCLAPVMAGDTVNISVQMTYAGQDFGGAGIGFRIPSGQLSPQYSFFISSIGACVAKDQSTNTTFFDNLSCSAVNKGSHATNTLAINQSGAQMDFYVNGSLVGTGDDATLSGEGIALEVNAIGPPVVFTTFVLTEWQ